MSLPATAAMQRPSVALRRHNRKNRALLAIPEAALASQMACRSGTPLNALRHAARATNTHIRNRYAGFIHDVGRNVYPLIVFTDHEVDGPDGVGSTLTLYQSNGSVTQVSPALDSHYEIYKACSHVIMGLAVEIGPYLGEEDVVDALSDGNESSVDEKKDGESALILTNDDAIEDVPWRASLLEHVQQVRVFRRALVRVAEADAETAKTPEDGTSDEATDKDETTDLHDGRVPSPELRETMLTMLSSVVEFCESCLATGVLDGQLWKALNQDNFPRIKMCMRAATKAQADACIPQIISWRSSLGPEEWRELYVVIPTVWAVDGENPRKTMMRQLMDADRINSHIITSEYPRDHSEARTLLGRVVGDRAIGRFAFGNEGKERRAKTMGLSSEVDVVQDDALPAIWNAIRENACPVRHSMRSSRSSGRSSAASRPSFC